MVEMRPVFIYANKLADYFINNSILKIDKNGFDEMARMFSEVPDEDKQEVFELFLSFLDTYGVPYDRLQFSERENIK